MVRRIREYLGDDKGIIKGAIGGVVATLVLVLATNLWEVGRAWADNALRCRGVDLAALAEIDARGLDAFQRAEASVLEGDATQAQYWFSIADGYFTVAADAGSIVSMRRRGVLHTATSAFLLADEKIGSEQLCNAAERGDAAARALVSRAQCADTDLESWSAPDR